MLLRWTMETCWDENLSRKKKAQFSQFQKGPQKAELGRGVNHGLNH